jgi:hypothetical protein
MGKSKEHLIGELLLRTKDGGKAFVQVYQGEGTFTLKRMMQDGRSEERSNIDVYNGDLNGYASEATLKWGDLVLDGVESKPRW